MGREKAVSYSDYLKIDQLISLQNPQSVAVGQPAHDEMLFIIIHQTYELWFKQILTELDSVLQIFSAEAIPENQMGVSVSRLDRITEIMRVLVDQVRVLETMTPLDFLDFRDLLYPASGFQSLQFRLLENKLGLKSAERMQYNSIPYHSYVSQADRDKMLAAEAAPSLFDLLEKWLERTPFLNADNFDFWQHYRTAVNDMFSSDRYTVEHNPILSPEVRVKNLHELEKNQDNFMALFEAEKYTKLQEQGLFRLSHRAIQAALLISLYRDEPILHLPYRLLFLLQDIDELMTTWRYRHALMAHRMLGRKIGTGGSSGHKYLKDATDQHRIFSDLFNLATFLIPRSKLPALPDSIRGRLGFAGSSSL